MGPPTIRDVAKQAGVGVGTVSRVLNNSPQVRPETRQRVLGAIRALGFRPNQLARQLSRGMPARSLGVVSPFITDHSFVARLKGVQEALSESLYDYDLVFYYIASPTHFWERLVNIVEQGTISGLLFVAMSLSKQETALLKEAGIPFAGINDHIISEYPAIGADNVAGGRLATEYLIELGHRKIAYIGDRFPMKYEYQFSSSEARYKGYVQALNAHNIPINPDYVQLGVHEQDVAYHQTKNLLDMPDRPTAIFSMSDVQALGCLAAIRDANLHVPDDISLIGFDDVEVSRLLGLTTIRQHLEQGGYLGMQYLLYLLDDESISAQFTGDEAPLLPAFEVVERQTTRHI